MIIPFFIPHYGCPHQCVFCNQKNIIGRNHPEEITTIPDKINHYLTTCGSSKPVQIAFYGGSFTALPLETQKAYLGTVRPFIQTGKIRNIRLSTRPDCIIHEMLSLLKEYEVAVVELGVQSMVDEVLTRSGRGHTSNDTVTAVKILKEHGFTIGLQLMPGLPGDSSEHFNDTVGRVIKLKPDFVRLYPALVVKDTPLEKLYTSGQYTPLTLEEAVSTCREAYLKFEKAGIAVIRMGLQPTEELEKPGTILAGPYHPAFGQLVESSMLLDKMRTALQNRKETNDTAVFLVNPRDVSVAIGQQRANIEAMKKEFGLHDVRFVENGDGSKRGDAVLLSY
ncbi:MAG: elongator complex protein 3 [Betaproteobacteria bacterium]